jgi:hypothetical protein
MSTTSEPGTIRDSLTAYQRSMRDLASSTFMKDLAASQKAINTYATSALVRDPLTAYQRTMRELGTSAVMRDSFAAFQRAVQTTGVAAMAAAAAGDWSPPIPLDPDSADPFIYTIRCWLTGLSPIQRRAVRNALLAVLANVIGLVVIRPASGPTLAAESLSTLVSVIALISAVQDTLDQR